MSVLSNYDNAHTNIGPFVLTPCQKINFASQLQRYVGSMQNEVAQAAAQSDQQDNEDVLGKRTFCKNVYI